MQASLLVTGQVDHPGQLLRPALAGVAVVPDVLIDPKRGHPGEPCRVGGEALQLRLDRPPQRRPPDPEPTGEPGDRGVLATQLPDRPGHGPTGQHATSGDQIRDLLGERASPARRLQAAPASLPPGDLHPHVGVRHVAQHPHPPPAAGRHDPAVRTAHQPPRRRDRHPHRGRAPIDALDPHTVQTQQRITARTGIGARARIGAPRSVRHVEVLEIYQAAWSLLILGDLDPYPPLPAPNPSVPTRSAKGPVRALAGLPETRPEIEHGVEELQKIAVKIADPDVRAYVEEAVLCLGVDALRAAVVFVWVGAARELQDRVWRHGAQAAEAATQKYYQKARISKFEDLAAIQEKTLLDVARELGVIDKAQWTILGQCLDTRNQCGHPGKYKPGVNKAKAHIEDIVGILFS